MVTYSDIVRRLIESGGLVANDIRQITQAALSTLLTGLYGELLFNNGPIVAEDGAHRRSR